MGEFRVSPQTLQQKAEELRGLNARYKGAIETLQNQETSLNGQWDGEAHDTFHREFTRDVSRLLQFYSAIEEYAQKLDQIAQEYAKAERANMNVASTRTV